MQIQLLSDHALVGFGRKNGEGFAAPQFTVKAAAAGKSAEIYVYDDIGPAWAGMIDAAVVVKSLKDIGGGPVTVRLNSRGGDAVEGIGIYNALRRYSNEGNQVLVGIDALAASAASLVAMAGDTIQMAANASMMIHRVWTVGWGNAGDFRRVAEVLDHYDRNVAKTYAAKTGLDEAKLLEMMADETWMNSDESVAAGFADAVGDALDVEAPKMAAGWYRGRQERPAAGERKFAEIAAMDRAVQLRRTRLGVR